MGEKVGLSGSTNVLIGRLNLLVAVIGHAQEEIRIAVLEEHEILVELARREQQVSPG